MSPAKVKTIITTNVVAAAVLVVASTSVLPNRTEGAQKTAKTLSSWRQYIKDTKDAGGGSSYDDTTMKVLSQAGRHLDRRTRTVYLIWCLYWGSIAVLMLSMMAGVSYLTSLQRLWPRDEGTVKPVDASGGPDESVAETDSA